MGAQCFQLAVGILHVEVVDTRIEGGAHDYRGMVRRRCGDQQQVYALKRLPQGGRIGRIRLYSRYTVAVEVTPQKSGLCPGAARQSRSGDRSGQAGVS